MRAVTFYILLVGFLQNAPADSPARYDPDFHLSFTEPGGSVSTICKLADGKILIGGFFQFVGSVPTTNVARINLDGSVDPSFKCSAAGTGWKLLADSKGRIYSLS